MAYSFTDSGKKYINLSIQDEFESSKRKLKFLTSEKYQIDFEETVLKGIDFSKEIKNTNSRYLKNAFHVKNFVEEIFNEKIINPDKFVIYFFEKVVLTVITCPSQDSAISIFNVLNDRGMPLSSIDILKASLMRNIEEKEDRIAFKSKWDAIHEELKFNGFDMDSLLNTYLYYRIATNPKNRLDKELISIFSQEKKSSLEIIKEIDDFSKAYIETYTSEDKYTYCLRYLKHKIYWTSLLSTAIFSKYQHTKELKKLLLAYYYQNWIAGATIARIKQTSFNILKLIKKNSPIEDIRNEIKTSLKKYSTTKTFKEEIKGEQVYGRRWDRAILLLIEYFSSDNLNHKFFKLDAKLHLEHVIPQKPGIAWKKVFNKKQIDRWTNSLANLTLLYKRKNSQAKNLPFKEKIEIYKNSDDISSSFLITQKITHCNKWDVQELEKREKKLLKKVMDTLDLFH